MSVQDLQSALQSFQSNITALQAQRIMNGANEQIQAIRSSEGKDADKLQALRNIAENTTYNLAAAGVPGSTLDALQHYIPEQYKPQNSEQALLFGTPEQKQAAEAEQKAKFGQQRQLIRDKMDYLSGKSSGGQNQKADQFATKEADSAVSKLLPDEKQRNAYSQNAMSVLRANRIKAALGQSSFNSASDLDKANKIPTQILHEAALGAASLVANGQTTDKSLGGFLPENIGTDSAKIESYLTNNLAAPDQAKFVKFYYNLANREAAVAQDAIQNSALSRAQGFVHTFQNPATSDRMKNFMTTLIPGTTPDMFQVDENSKLVFQPAEEQKRVYNDITNGLLDAKKAASSADPQIKDSGIQKLKAFGYDASTPVNQIKADIDYRTKSGDLIPLKNFAAQNPQYALPVVPVAPNGGQ